MVYLWVEDYKNIKKQGFNFSPRFDCKFYDEYDDHGKLEDNCKLEIIEKKEDEYIKDFFGENINVTAIVGKNGSGKSSLFESFDFSWKEVYYIYYKEGQLYSNYFDKEINGKNIKIETIQIGIDVIYMNRLFFMQREENGLLNSLYQENLYVKKFKNLKNNKLNPENFHKNMLALLFKQICLYPSFFKPKNISIKLNLVNKEFKFTNLLDLLTKGNILSNYKFYYKIYLKSLEILESYKDRHSKDYENDELTEELKEFIEQTEDKILEYEYEIDEEWYFSYYSDTEIFICLI